MIGIHSLLDLILLQGYNSRALPGLSAWPGQIGGGTLRSIKKDRGRPRVGIVVADSEAGSTRFESTGSQTVEEP